MAYITKAEVKAKQELLKVLNKQYGIKSTFSGSNTSTLTLTITSGVIDFIENWCTVLNASHYRELHDKEITINQVKQSQYLQVNHYYLDTNFSGIALEYLQKAYQIMLNGHFDESDIQTDNFHCSWYNSIRIGRWNKGYVIAG